ncbi:MAG: DUF2490 domain-containing protein [Candidatus Cryptobacteroides sp.]
MRRRLFLLVVSLTTLCAAATAAEKDEFKYYTRLTAEVDYGITRSLGVHASEELRLNERFGFARTYTGAGLTYKPLDWLKMSLDYYAIGVQKKDEIPDELTGDISYNSYVDWRHRAAFAITGTYKLGGWRFSLRERWQGTYRMKDVNIYQTARFLMALRTRLKISYKFYNVPLEPFVSCDMRVALNGPKWSTEATDAVNFASAKYLGGKDVFIDRWRTEAGVEWQILRNHSMQFYFTYDRTTGKEIDSKRKEAVLKAPITVSHSNHLFFGVSYAFKF